MLKTKKWLLPLLGLALAGSALAQSVDGAKFYKLEFVVKEVEGGKTVNARSFSTMLATQVPGQESSTATIRAGGRVSVTTNNNTGFYDVGVNIDVRSLREVQNDISISVNADINTLVQDSPGATPVTRANRWQGTALVTVKKPTVIFAYDDLSSKRQFQLELTATPVK